MPILNVTDTIPVPPNAHLESGWTVGELVKHAFFLADEQPNAIYTIEEVETLLDMGLRAIARKLGFPYIDATHTVTPGKRTVHLTDAHLDASGTADVSRVTVTDSRGEVELARVGREPLTPKQGKPKSYFLRGETLTLVEEPDTAYTLTVRYRHMPERYHTNETPPMSHDLLELAVIYSVHQMKLKDDQLSTADRWLGIYNDRMRTMLEGVTGVFPYEGE